MDVIQAKPKLSNSQLAFRIGLARKRTALYPMDSMDFILMDLERPDLSSRHAHWCTGDLSGRTLEFLSCAEGIDGKNDERLAEFFDRVLCSQKASGLIGRYSGVNANNEPLDKYRSAGMDHIFGALVRYYEATNDSRALDAAIKNAEHILTRRDEFIEAGENGTLSTFETLAVENFARLYNTTGDKRYLDFCVDLCSYINKIEYAHSHTFLGTLRGLQLAAIYTGDKSLNEKPEFFRKKIIEEHYEMADGGVSEVFPRGYRNEGCSVADWLMLNLNSAFISGDDETYQRTENILYNALFFNQLITGGFGHRDLTERGYAGTGLSEAWWCCTENCGLAMTEFAKHAVVLRGNELCVNFLLSGEFTVAAPGKPDITVNITTDYPRSVYTVINVKNMPKDVKLKVNIPTFVKDKSIEEKYINGVYRAVINGKIGHYTEKYDKGYVLKYGPLVLSPSIYYWGKKTDLSEGDVPAGYIPQMLPGGKCGIVCPEQNADGFLDLPHEPLPDWSYFDEGTISRTAVGNSSVNVQVEFENGKRETLRFTPLCYNLSNLSFYDAPLVFDYLI